MKLSLITGLTTLLVTTTTTAHAALVEHWWNITYTTANPDGLYPRTVIGVNGTWPPPPIFVNQRDTLRVHAFNGLGDVGTSLHSHGNFFNGTNYYDGAVGTTQCAIPPGQSLTYEIPIDLQAGTFWIHGHFNGQYVDGLRAPVVILPEEPRSDGLVWDDEYTVVVSDWYHDTHPTMVKERFLVWWNPTGAEPVPGKSHLTPPNPLPVPIPPKKLTPNPHPLLLNLESALIYIAQNETYLSPYSDLMAGKGTNDNAVIPFEAGKRYRIRVINMSSLSMFHLQIKDHPMKIIEMDGIDSVPTEIDMLTIAVAQRYSVYVEAKNASDTNYAMMVWQDPDMYDAIPDALILNNTVQVQYSTSAPAAEPFTFDTPPTEYSTYPIFDDTIVKPLLVNASAPPDQEFTIVATFDTFDDGSPRSAFNDITYQMPKTPSLFTQMSMGNDSNNARVYGSMTNALMLDHLAMIQVTIVNTDAGFHPFHLHGHEFQVMGKTMDYLSNDTSINPPIEEQSNPMRRDTVTVPPGGATTIRFRADNPGAWLLHCHVEWHMNQGLAVTFISFPNETQKLLTIPQTMIDHCEALDIPATGNIVGLMSTTDFKGEPYGPWPQVLGWRPKGIAAMAGCVLTVVLGFMTVVWYSYGSLDDAEIEEEIKRKQEMQTAKGGKYGFIKKLVKGNKGA